MNEKSRECLSKAWRILNFILAIVFGCLIIDAWIEVFYFRDTEKYYYYIATLFIIPFLTCLIAVCGWDLDNQKG